MAHIKPRPTTYRGTQMRSRLEAAWAEQFDAWGWAWEYEPRCLATEEGQYLPDFYVITDTGDAYVEVKPAIDVDQMINIMNNDMPRWGRIIKENDKGASKLLLCFGANPVGVVAVVQLELDTNPPRSSKVRGLTGPPVASLHATKFSGGE